MSEGLFSGTVDDFKTALDAVVDRANKAGQALITQAASNFEVVATRVIDHALAGVDRTLASLDGWTATVANRGFAEPITIKLSKPKAASPSKEIE